MLGRFYLIVDNAQCLAQFLPLGVRCVQLRVKDKPDTHVRQEIRAAKALCEQYHCHLIINDHWKLAIDEGCAAIHLGQEDLDCANMAAIAEAGIRYGISTHDRAELNRALSHEPDYIALGPIYATILKKMPWQPQGLAKLKRWKSAIGSIPLVAIGGFTPERAAGAFEHGADSVCVVTDVLLNDNPCSRIEQWLAVTKQAS